MQLKQTTNYRHEDSAVHRRRCLRIGAVSYLNSKPLIYGMQEKFGADCHLSLAVPSKLADQLNRGEIDIGLIPVVEYFRNSNFRPVSNAAIACCGPVWSVRVLFRREPRSVRSIAMDEGSRTSVALTQVLFHAKFGSLPAVSALPLEEDPRAAKADAVLVIGDRAIHPQEFRDEFAWDWDLGQVWFELTGLPFVFALWVASSESIASEFHSELLERTRDHGIAHLDQIASESSGNYRLTSAQCLDYLTNYIRFYLGPAERNGMEEFRRRCRAIGLAP